MTERAHALFRVETRTGSSQQVKLLPGAVVYVYEPGSTTVLLEQTMYGSKTGSDVLTNPLTADADASISFYLDVGQRVTFAASAALGTAPEIIDDYDASWNPGDLALRDLGTLTSPTITGQAIYKQTGPTNFDAEADGAVGDGATDDTAALQATINRIKAQTGLVTESRYYGARLRFNHAKYRVSALDCTFMHNVDFVGASGHGGTMMQVTAQTSAVHGAGGKAVFDGAGSQAISFENFLIDASGIDGSHIAPMAGWLFAGTGAVGANCAANRMTNCGAWGPYQVAPLVTTYSGAHVFVGCGWQQWKKDRPVILMGNAFPSGHGALTSFAGTSGSPDPFTFPPTVSGTGGGSNTFIGCEAHALPASGGEAGPYTGGAGHALSIEACQSLSWIGGIIAGYGPSIIRIGGASRGITIRPTTIYSDQPGLTPTYILLFDPATTADAIEVWGGLTDSVPLDSPGGAFIRFGSNATVDKLYFGGFSRGGAVATTCLAISAGGYTSAATEIIKGDSLIDCDGLTSNLNTASHGGSIGTHVQLIDSGTLTMDTAAHNYSPITPPRVRVHRGTDQTLNNNDFTTTVSFSASDWNTDAMWEGVTHPDRITINTPGLYTVKGGVRFDANATGSRYLGIYLNGSTALVEQWLIANGTQPTIIALSIDWQLAAGDYLTLMPSQDRGGTLALKSVSTTTPFLSATRQSEA
jgi:hypothetical protein